MPSGANIQNGPSVAASLGTGTATGKHAQRCKRLDYTCRQWLGEVPLQCERLGRPVIISSSRPVPRDIRTSRSRAGSNGQAPRRNRGILKSNTARMGPRSRTFLLRQHMPCFSMVGHQTRRGRLRGRVCRAPRIAIRETCSAITALRQCVDDISKASVDNSTVAINGTTVIAAGTDRVDNFFTIFADTISSGSGAGSIPRASLDGAGGHGARGVEMASPLTLSGESEMPVYSLEFSAMANPPRPKRFWMLIAIRT